MRYRYLLCWISVLYMTLVGTAVGQPKPTPEDRFNQAVEMAKTGDYEEAVEICREVIERLPASEHSRVHKLLGYAYKKLDMFPNAWHYLTRYLESSGKEDTTAGGWLQEVEATLKRTHVKVTFTCEPPGTTISLPASLTCPLTWWFVPGKHLVRADSPGYKPRNVEVDVRERGDSGARKIRLTALAQRKPPVEGSAGRNDSGTTVVTRPVESGKPARALEWTLIGSGLALGVTGGIFQGIGYSKNEDLHSKYLGSTDYSLAADAKSAYDKAYRDDVRPKEITSYVLYGIGGAAIVAGVVTWLIRQPLAGAEVPDAAFSITPLSVPGGSGALMTLGF